MVLLPIFASRKSIMSNDVTTSTNIDAKSTTISVTTDVTTL